MPASLDGFSKLRATTPAHKICAISVHIGTKNHHNSAFWLFMHKVGAKLVVAASCLTGAKAYH